jgi:hypothetical protein
MSIAFPRTSAECGDSVLIATGSTIWKELHPSTIILENENEMADSDVHASEMLKVILVITSDRAEAIRSRKRDDIQHSIRNRCG